MSMLRTEVLSRLGDIAGQWDSLVARQPLPSPFLRSWWVDNVAEGRLAVVTCWADDALVGGAAFQLDSLPVGPIELERVRSVGQGVLAPDHLDLVVAPGHHLAVARAVLGWLRRSGSRVLDLDGLAAQGTLATLFSDDVVEGEPAPFARIGPDAAAYLNDRPGKVRSTLKRTHKRFEREGVDFRRVPAEEIDSALEALARLHDGRWATESQFLRGWVRFCDAARAGAGQGDVVVHQLRDAAGEVIATELDLVLGTTIAFYQAGRRTEREWRGAGSVLRGRIIAEAEAAGCTEYDLLRGDEAYKSDWSTGAREVVRVRRAIGAAAQLARGVRRAGARATTVAGRLSPSASPPGPTDRPAPPD